MKNCFRIFILFFVLSIAACKKEDTGTTPLKPKIKTRVLAGSTIDGTYTYDSQGRLVLEQYANGEHFTYTYNGSAVVMQAFTQTGTVVLTQTYYLNAQQRADSLVQNSTGMFDYYKYKYDEEGHMIMEKHYNSLNTLTNKRYYTYENGNLKTMYNAAAGGTLLQQFNYTYDTGHTNTIGHQNMGLDFLGTLSDNPHTLIINLLPPDYLSATEYSYQYDSEGRISSTTVGTNVYTYTYY